VRGFDPALIAQIKQIGTINFGQASFDTRFAKPLAIEIMMGDKGAFDALGAQREQGGQRTALQFGVQNRLVGRPLTIVVDAALPTGGRAHREAVVELTGSPVRPYVVRSYG
jgi:hypothetical protein